jgi:cytochrome c oxidase cbb3-type subunit 2
MVFFGAARGILPQAARRQSVSAKLQAVQLWCALPGVGLCYIARLTSGVAQGWLLNDPGLSFTLISRTVAPPLAFAAMGEVLILAASLAFALDLALRLFKPVDNPPELEPPPGATRESGKSPEPRSPWAPALLLGLFLSLSVSWVAFVAGPVLQLGGLGQAPTTDAEAQLYPTPRSGQALLGAEVYRACGCAACHTQQVRPAEAGPDIARGWGKRRSVARDYIFDNPAMPGALRAGPDLANMGARQNASAFLARLRSPGALARGAMMPPFPFLFETSAGGPPLPRPKALALAAYLQSLRADGVLYETPAPKPAAAPRPADIGSTPPPPPAK